MQLNKICQSLEFNLMILRRADEIAASGTISSGTPACPILPLFLEQILVLLLVIENVEFCWWTAAAMIVFGNFSKNTSVREALCKCKGIRSLQVHRYWCEVWEGECI